MKKALAMVLIMAAALLALAGCPNPADETDPDSNPGNELTNTDGTLTEDAFTNHTTDYSVLVRNYTGKKLVAFKGDLESGKLIGGIPASTGNHGLPNDPALFNVTDAFSMIILTEEQYNANKSNLASLKYTPFTRVFVFFNKNGKNLKVYDLSDRLGGNNSLVLINAAQNINVEMRLNGVAGETLGYLPAGLMTTTLYLEDDDYEVFPVFQRYNQARDTLDTYYPKNTAGDPWGYSLGFHGNANRTINLKDELKSLTLTSGTALICVSNGTTSGDISFYKGTDRQETPSGYYLIGPDELTYFQIDMPKSGNNYGDSVVVSNWKFGPTGYEVGLRETAAGGIASTITIERDKMYTITVEGNRNNPASLKAYISSTTAMDNTGFNW